MVCVSYSEHAYVVTALYAITDIYLLNLDAKINQTENMSRKTLALFHWNADCSKFYNSERVNISPALSLLFNTLLTLKSRHITIQQSMSIKRKVEARRETQQNGGPLWATITLLHRNLFLRFSFLSQLSHLVQNSLVRYSDLMLQRIFKSHSQNRLQKGEEDNFSQDFSQASAILIVPG